MRTLAGHRDVPLLANTPIAFGHPTLIITFPAASLQHPLPRVPAVTGKTEAAGWERGKPAADLGGALRQ